MLETFLCLHYIDAFIFIQVTNLTVLLMCESSFLQTSIHVFICINVRHPATLKKKIHPLGINCLGWKKNKVYLRETFSDLPDKLWQTSAIELFVSKSPGNLKFICSFLLRMFFKSLLSGLIHHVWDKECYWSRCST